MSDIILSARHLAKFYKQRTGKLGLGTTLIKALDDVSLDLQQGTTLAVVGESGSGKSTLARCLLQLQPLDGGEVLFQARIWPNCQVRPCVLSGAIYKWCFRILLLRSIHVCV